MLAETAQFGAINRRVRAILLTKNGSVLLIKRVKPNSAVPYWVAPGGGVERYDTGLHDTLRRELDEELGAEAKILARAFVLEHRKAGKQLEEHFFVCQLEDYDVSKRFGPEFEDPARGQYIPEEIPLDAATLVNLNIKTPEMRDWIVTNLDNLQQSCKFPKR